MTSQRSRIEQAKAPRVLRGITTSDREFEALTKNLFPTSAPSRLDDNRQAAPGRDAARSEFYPAALQRNLLVAPLRFH
jgi:hypothetical protein